MPRGWIYVANFGIRQMTMDARAVVASVGLGQDTLSTESKVADYIEKQKELIGGRLKEAKFARPQAIAFPGAEEGQLNTLHWRRASFATPRCARPSP